MDADNDPYAEARKKRRKPVKVGDQLRFVSTVHGRDAKGLQVRNYSDRIVEVISVVEPMPSDDGEPMFDVRASDGLVFAAWEGELNGWYYETGQWVQSDGQWAGL